MKTLKIGTLALALAATAFEAAAQSPKPEPAPKPGGLPPPPQRERVEVRVENRDFDEIRDGGFTHAVVGDVDANVKRIFAGAEPDQPLVISTGALDEGAVANLEEDLTIMARILEKSVNRGNGQENSGDRRAMGIHLWALGQGNRGARDLYIDGHGAIFILNANIPLSGPLKPITEEKEKKEPADSAWESARNEVFGDSGEAKGRKPRKERPDQAFDPERLDALKKSLTDSLKNAANIRGLKDNESVTVVVQEQGGRVFAASGGGFGGGGNFRGPRNPQVKSDVFAFSQDGPRSARALLTLRAKKSDIDAFSKGKIDADEFRKKVSVSSYQSGGEGGRSKP